MHQYSSNSIIMIVILTMHVLVILLEMCLCYMVTCYQVSMTPAVVYNTCAQVLWTPARRCYRHLRAGVIVTNLYTLVKHASWAGVLLSPCFSNFLARINFVLQSLPEILGDFVCNSSNS